MNKIFYILFCSIFFMNATYYVAPDGNDEADGSIGTPWASFQHAIDMADKGDTVYFRDGIWYMTDDILYTPPTHGNNGAEDTLIYYFNYPGEKPIFDWSQYNEEDWFNPGMDIQDINFVHFKGLEFRNIYQSYGGVQTSGVFAQAIQALRSYNMIFENMSIHDCGGRAFNLQSGLAQHPEVEYDTTRFINCDLYNLCDSVCVSQDSATCAESSIGGTADGIKVDCYGGQVVIVTGCRIWGHSDNGIDNSSSHRSIIYNNWVFHAGTGSDGSRYEDTIEDYGGEQSGIKFGSIPSECDSAVRYVHNNLSCFNLSMGFDESNSYELLYPNWCEVYNNTSYKNLIAFGNFSYAIDRDTLNIYRNNLSYKEHASLYGEDYNMNQPSLARSCEANCALDEAYNSWNENSCTRPVAERIALTNADFILTDSTMGVAQLKQSRKADSSLPDITLMHLASSSDARNAGIDVGLPYSYSAPDLGYFEYDTVAEASNPTAYTGNLNVDAYNWIVFRGLAVDDGGGTVTEFGVVVSESPNPTTADIKLVMNHHCNIWEDADPSTTYYYRSFATNEAGTAYGTEYSFTTP